MRYCSVSWALGGMNLRDLKQAMAMFIIVFAGSLVLAGCGAEPPPPRQSLNSAQAAATANEAKNPTEGERTPPEDAALNALLPAGQTMGPRMDGDLNGDGRRDVAFVGIGAEASALYVAVSVDKPAAGYALIGKGQIAADQPDRIDLSINGRDLTVEFDNGGTLRVLATYQLRYDAPRKAMRLIGFNMSTWEIAPYPDMDKRSWNLLTGQTIRTISKSLDDKGEKLSTSEKRGKLIVKPIMLETLPDPYVIEARLDGRPLPR